MTTENTNPSGQTGQLPQMPEGGFDKYYDKATGNYDWAGHGREAAFQRAQQTQRTAPAPGAAGLDLGNDPPPGTKPVLDKEALAAEFQQHGKLTDATLAALDKVGLKDFAEDYVKLLGDAVNRAKADALAYVGGQEAWDQLLAWSRTNLTADERAGFNEMLRKPATFKAAVDTLKARAAQSGTITVPGQTATTQPVAFGSREEMLEAMRKTNDRGKRLYDVDPKYRATVEARIRAMHRR